MNVLFSSWSIPDPSSCWIGFISLMSLAWVMVVVGYVITMYYGFRVGREDNDIFQTIFGILLGSILLFVGGALFVAVLTAPPQSL